MPYPDPYYGQTPGTSYYGAPTGGKMAIDPLSIAAAAGSALSGIFGQKGISNVEKNLAREGLNKQGAPIAAELSKRLALLPLADRASFLLSQRLTPGVMSGTGFSPKDLFNPTGATSPTYSATNQGALATANAGYQPGQGGFDPGVLRQALANLGSSSDQSYSTTAGGAAPWAADQFAPMPTEKDVRRAQSAAEKDKVMGAVNKIFGNRTSGAAPGGLHG